MKRKYRILVLVLIVILAYLSYCLIYVINEKKSLDTQAAAPVATCSINAGELLNLINAERSKLGAPSMQIDSVLSTIARSRTDDMIARKYFSHTLPDGGQWSKSFRDAGIHAAIAEDLGSNDNTPQQSWDEFKASPSHYKSIIDPQYTRIGISAVCTDYKLEMAVDESDKQYLGTPITDLTAIVLAGVEPKVPQQPQTKVEYVKPQPVMRPNISHSTTCTSRQDITGDVVTTCY